MTYTEIPVQGTFSEKECLWFLNRGFDDCIYRVFTDKIRRAFKFEDELTLVDIIPMPDKICLAWLTGIPSKKCETYVSDFLGGWFDLDIDLGAFYRLLNANKKLAYMTESYKGLRFIGIPDIFEALGWAIIGQQINLKFAYLLKRRLVEQYGDFIIYQGEKYFLFPSPEVIARAEVSDLRALQLSGKKAEYLLSASNFIKDGNLSREILLDQPDLASRLKYLTDLRGIGPWTANYVLMKSLKERSCVPYADAGLRNALVKHQIICYKNKPAAINEFFSSFEGWESYLAFYLWRSLAPMTDEQIVSLIAK
jgi:DNA-3-methyladenine glycosylase II